MVIFKSYLYHFFWSHLTKNLAASILNLIFSSLYYSLVTFISILSDLSIQHLHSQHSFSHQPTTLYCSCWSSSYSQHQYICSFWNLGHSLHYLLWTFWSNSSWILPHQHPSSCFSRQSKEKIVGGGTAFLIHNSSTILSTSSEIFKSFELSSITIKFLNSKLTVFNIYRNHYLTNTSSHDPVPFSDFLIDFQNFISTAATTPHEFIITGDFNIHTHNHSDLHSQQFHSLLNNANLIQHVNFPTHQAGHTLDLVITTKNSTLSPTITHSLVSPSDHFPIFTSLAISPPSSPPITEHFFRCIKSINLNNFIRDIRTSRLITHPPTNLSDLVDCYNLTLSNILNKHAPLKSKLLRSKPSNPWFTPALQKLKSARRHFEKIWSRSRSTFDLKLLRSATNHYHNFNHQSQETLQL